VPEEAGIDGVELEAAVLKAFGRLSGFIPAFRGFELSFRPPENVVVDGAIVLAEKDRTTFSAPSSRLRPSSTGSDSELELEPPCSSSSAFARSICSAISKRSRCSSDIVERSFLSAAAYSRTGS